MADEHCLELVDLCRQQPFRPADGLMRDETKSGALTVGVNQFLIWKTVVDAMPYSATQTPASSLRRWDQLCVISS